MILDDNELIEYQKQDSNLATKSVLSGESNYSLINFNIKSNMHKLLFKN